MSNVFIISAPSGSGKTTLVSQLMAKESNLEFSISCTTRKPRGQEENGKEYYFVSKAEFLARIAADEFLEWAQVFDNYYGTSRRELARADAAGKDLVLDIDVQGARQLKEKIAGAVSIFILAPSRAELEQRLRARSEDSGEVIRRRLEEAAAEIRNYSAYDYVIVNERVEESARDLRSIIRAERVRRQRMDAKVGAILKTFES
jgi:guanylate kinase